MAPAPLQYVISPGLVAFGERLRQMVAGPGEVAPGERQRDASDRAAHGPQDREGQDAGAAQEGANTEVAEVIANGAQERNHRRSLAWICCGEVAAEPSRRVQAHLKSRRPPGGAQGEYHLHREGGCETEHG